MNLISKDVVLFLNFATVTIQKFIKYQDILSRENLKMGLEEDVSRAFKEFMGNVYLIIPTKESHETLLDSGFEIRRNPKDQYFFCNKSQKNIRGRDFHSLMAKVYPSALALEFVLNNDDKTEIEKLSEWLGIAEKRLARLCFKREVIETFYKKSIDHFLISRKYGNNSVENTKDLGEVYLKLGNHKEAMYYLHKVEDMRGNRWDLNSLGECYLKLGKFEKAMDYLIKSRADGTITRNNASLMSECYLALGDFEKALKELHICFEITKKARLDKKWAHVLNHRFEDFSTVLWNSRDEISKEVYKDVWDGFSKLVTEYCTYLNKNNLKEIPKVLYEELGLMRGPERVG